MATPPEDTTGKLKTYLVLFVCASLALAIVAWGYYRMPALVDSYFGDMTPDGKPPSREASLKEAQQRHQKELQRYIQQQEKQRKALRKARDRSEAVDYGDDGDGMVTI